MIRREFESVGDVMKMGCGTAGSRWKLVCGMSGEIRLCAWELAVEKAEVELATSIGRGRYAVCKAVAAVEVIAAGAAGDQPTTCKAPLCTTAPCRFVGLACARTFRR